jgi:hypothetical protein
MTIKIDLKNCASFLPTVTQFAECGSLNGTCHYDIFKIFILQQNFNFVGLKILISWQEPIKTYSYIPTVFATYFEVVSTFLLSLAVF